MPLVFVHGVNVRRGQSAQELQTFDKQVEARNHLFRTVALAGLIPPPTNLHIENPYWGDEAARFTYDLVSVPAGNTETFGPGDDSMAQVLVETVPYDVAVEIQAAPGRESALLLTLARTHSLTHAIDTMIAAAVRQQDENVSMEDQAAISAELATFSAQALAFAAANPDTSWLNARHPTTGEPLLQNDDDFLEALAERVQAEHPPAEGVETFGIGSVVERLKGAAQGLANVAQRTFHAVVGTIAGAVGGAAIGGAPETVVRALRPLATRRAGTFFGDVFMYLANRGTKEAPGPIPRIIVTALNNAASKRTEKDDKLIVIAHSMGGNIVYDVLTHYLPDLQVDLLVTVGAQVALFKELRLYQEDHGAGTGVVPPAATPKPTSVGKWLNVFDPLDVLGFAVEGVFADTRDFSIANQGTVLDAHTLYFDRPAFHQRLRARMAELGFGSPL